MNTVSQPARPFGVPENTGLTPADIVAPFFPSSTGLSPNNPASLVPELAGNTIRPSHYKLGGLEAITVIRAWGLSFSLGNAVKYIQRHKLKGTPLEDLLKARQYLDFAIEELQAELKPSEPDPNTSS